MASTSLCNALPANATHQAWCPQQQSRHGCQVQRCFRQGAAFRPAARRRLPAPCQMSLEQDTRAEVAQGEDLAGAPAGEELENPESEAARKKAEADRLRAAEKFMVIGSGEATCPGCGYEYRPKNGDSEYPVPPGTLFQDLPKDWQCPICGAEKNMFQSKVREIAGFAENQKYGLGTNSMTSGQKGALIYGSLLLFFALFLAGYFIQ